MLIQDCFCTFRVDAVEGLLRCAGSLWQLRMLYLVTYLRNGAR